MDAENNEITTSTSEVKTKNGYAFLRELCSFNANFSSWTPQTNPVSNRVAYITHQLTTYNVPFVTDIFRADGILHILPTETDLKYVNLYVYIKGLDETKTIVFGAHHDVANPESFNCQDNSASVCNLIDLAIRLTKEVPATNVLIFFSDAEEIVQPAKCGANRVATKIKTGEFGNVECIYNLELTAQGTHYWFSYEFQRNIPYNNAATHLRQIYPTIARVKTPYSDSYCFEMHALPSVCIGSLTEPELKVAKQGQGCRTWAVCHSKRDTFEANAIEEDMNAFVNFLVSLI